MRTGDSSDSAALIDASHFGESNGVFFFFFCMSSFFLGFDCFLVLIIFSEKNNTHVFGV